MSQFDESNNKGKTGLTRRDFLETAGLTTLAIGMGGIAMPPTAQAAQPYVGKSKPGTPLKPKRYNVLFIVTDQERYFPELTRKGHWPGRDRLAQMGTTFENHQACSMVCTSSRSVIFTGQHVQHTRMFDNTDFPWVDNMSFNIPTIGHMMRDAGYYTAYQGKWHLHQLIHEHANAGNPNPTVDHDIMDKYGFSDFTGINYIVGAAQFGYLTDQYVTATSQAWLRQKGKALNDAGQPWFKTIGLVNPHDIMFYDTDKPGEKVQGATHTMFEIAGDPDNEVYKKKWGIPLSPSRKQSLTEPGRPMAHYDYQESMGMLCGKIPNEDERWKKMQDYYLNCISDNDRSVDTILTELENLDMLDNTIIIMTSDHGELAGAHGMSGKGATAYREQNNVPFVIYHPDMSGGKKCKAVTAHNDILPTILSMTGADKKQEKEVYARLKGHDISPLLASPEKASYDAVREGALYCFSMWAFMDVNWLGSIAKAKGAGEQITLDNIPKPNMKKRSNIRTVFDGRYKYSRYFSSREHNRPTSIEQIFNANDVELFDLKNDPYELNNLALNKQNQALLLAMNDKLNRLIDSEVGTDDGFHLPDIKGVNWAIERFDP
ncbi:sulfatase-like hydrolase/transferase [Photobacterium sp. SDRW27]|uniref:sulfatase-like hydrolase/transferase n=1 Tax=Photobacterium obscurum TaxID=2829490 RepID=UPI00224408CF|nr:sulfatase-like hydrolase/transferase [Photobacterium obscurum]MCW8328483.1 sulfatase-like hydrolase/transferase [Photobacterium obscurum]